MLLSIEVDLPVMSTRKQSQVAILAAAEFHFYVAQIGEVEVEALLRRSKVPDPRAQKPPTSAAYVLANYLLRAELRRP